MPVPPSLPRPSRRLSVLLVAGALCASSALISGVPGAEAAALTPRTPSGLPRQIEPRAPFVAGNSCAPAARPGTVALAGLLRATYPGAAISTTGHCRTTTSTTEFFDGRALDWKVSTRSSTQRAQADAVTSWLLAADSAGNTTAIARRLGVMSIIWNGRQWRAAKGWQALSDCATHPEPASDARCHRSGMRVSLSWAGALSRTSFWSKSVAASDYGPCRAADLNWSGAYRTSRPVPCPSYRVVTAAQGSSTTLVLLTRYSGFELGLGAKGEGVTAIQGFVRVPTTGVFDAQTVAGVRNWQLANKLTGTGSMNSVAWRAMLAAARKAATPAPPVTRPPTGVFPTSAGPGWRRLYGENFTSTAATGSFVNERPDDWYLRSSHPYANSLRSYPDGWGTTGDLSLNYASKTAAVVSTTYGAPGVFAVTGHSANVPGGPRSLGGSFFPVIKPDAGSNHDQMSQTFGRYSVRFRTDGGQASTAGGAGYGSAFLLWPANDNWSEGEVDYPEMAWGGKITGYVHRINQPQENAHIIDTATVTDKGWHTATIEWYPNALVFYLDGKLVKKVTDNVPQTPFRWGFQSGGHSGTPRADVKGKLLVDWIAIDAYAGATPPG